MSKLSMQDIAKITNVSRPTVSRVIHSPEKVNAKTRSKVLKAMKQHNYIYDAVAGELASSKSSVIGMIVPTNSSSIISQVANAIHDVAGKHNYSIISSNSYYDSENELNHMTTLMQRRVAGIILVGLSSMEEKYLERISKLNVPLVVVWDMPEHKKISYVAMDGYNGAYTAAKYLLDLGHERIGFVSGYFNRLDRVQKRYKGFNDALLERGIRHSPKLFRDKKISMESGMEACDQLLALKNKPTAIMTTSDTIAMGVMASVRKHHLRIPEDISIIGFDDLELATYCSPPLTTVRVPSYNIGKKAANLLFSNIMQKKDIVEKIMANTELVVRKSCGVVKKAG